MRKPYYPVDLLLSQETSNSFKELAEMDEMEKLTYYFYIMEDKKIEQESIQESIDKEREKREKELEKVRGRKKVKFNVS